MKITLDPRSPVPLPAQIAGAIQLAIARGDAAPGDQLPTVRQLSVELRVNANTVARVYAELERDGVLETRRGRGTFVAPRPRVEPGTRDQRLLSLCRSFVRTCAEEGYTLGEIEEALGALAKNKEVF